VMNHSSGDVAVIDPLMQKRVANIAVGGALEIGAADGKGLLYVNVEDKNEIAVVDIGQRKVTNRIALKDCDGPTGLAYHPKPGVWVSRWAGAPRGTATASGKDVATLKIGKGPDTVMFDAARGVFLIPCGRDGTLSVIGAQSAMNVSVIGTVATQTSARTGALD